MTETFRQQQDRLFRERVERQREIDRDAAAYERQQADRREVARIEGQRAELEEHLRERGTRYVETVGHPPSAATLAGWRDEFAAGKERGHQADERRRLEDAGYDQAGQRDTIF